MIPPLIAQRASSVPSGLFPHVTTHMAMDCPLPSLMTHWWWAPVLTPFLCPLQDLPTCLAWSRNSTHIGKLSTEWTIDVKMIWEAKYHMNVLSGFLFLYSLGFTYSSLFLRLRICLCCWTPCTYFAHLTTFLLFKRQTPSHVLGLHSASPQRILPSCD